ncbi:hypothetical protein CEUSTIGMA_g4638.t1 [Chlamydomonas eustigma]|uniref:Uncharacterized protein n=1 Tax=Chlamydomonas eustigma TaxID=1157962 RepID=A0A250X2S1_9CHLO|nr:hypothetical protein CEUSTIGMA_g4638.t1 [Chlamydomonas eustigma]|eukprot:GAX77192.1 hypothetical protein CEUSTIGMA_g4638.t1 [Chlamydomonas eustigma]
MFLHMRLLRAKPCSKSSIKIQLLQSSRKLVVKTVISDVTVRVAGASTPGFCGLENVTSPSDLKASWYQLTKPRLDALLTASLRCGPEVQLLHLMDALNCELKNMQIKSRHCSAQHSSRAWQKAGLEVSSACDKYEAYVYRSRSLHNKLLVLRDRLIHTEGSSLFSSPSSAEKKDLLHQSRPSRTNEGSHCVLEYSQLLRLLDLLLLSFTRGNVGVENGLNHLLMLTGGGGAAEASGSLQWNRVRELMAAERELAAAVQTTLGPGPGPATLLNLFQVDWGGALLASFEKKVGQEDFPLTVLQNSSGQGDYRTRMDTSASGSNMEEKDGLYSSPCQMVPMASRGSKPALSSAPVSSPVMESGIQDSDVQQLPWTHDPLLQPLLCRAAALGLPTGYLLLERTVLKHLLTQHPHRPLREAVYVCGVLPRKEALLRLRTQMAIIRDELAVANGDDSAANASLSSLCIKDPGNVLMLLEACAAACQPIAESQLKHLSAMLSNAKYLERLMKLTGEPKEVDALGGSSGLDTVTQGTIAFKQGAMVLHSVAELPTQQAGEQMLPWDFSYAQHLLLAHSCPLISSEILISPCMELQHVLKVMGHLCFVLGCVPPKVETEQCNRNVEIGNQAIKGGREQFDPSSFTSLKQLSVAPVVVHHQGTYCAYITSFIIASLAWEAHLSLNPLDTTAGRFIRAQLFESRAGLFSTEDLICTLLASHSPNGNRAMDHVEEAYDTHHSENKAKDYDVVREGNDEDKESLVCALLVKMLEGSGENKMSRWLWSANDIELQKD